MYVTVRAKLLIMAQLLDALPVLDELRGQSFCNLSGLAPMIFILEMHNQKIRKIFANACADR